MQKKELKNVHEVSKTNLEVVKVLQVLLSSTFLNNFFWKSYIYSSAKHSRAYFEAYCKNYKFDLWLLTIFAKTHSARCLLVSLIQDCQHFNTKSTSYESITKMVPTGSWYFSKTIASLRTTKGRKLQLVRTQTFT